MITLPSSTMNITGFLNWRRGSSFGNESRIAVRTISREKTLLRLALVTGDGAVGIGATVVDIYVPPSSSSARFSSRTLTPGSPKKPHERPVVFWSISFCTVASGTFRLAAIRRAWSCA